MCAYGRFSITRNKVTVTVVAHVASWVLHNGPVIDGMIIAHECDNPRCIRIDHLAMKTQTQNMRDMVSRGRNRQLSGEKNGSSKLTDVQVLEIVSDLKSKRASIRELAERFGVAFQTIYKLARGGRKGIPAIIEPTRSIKLSPEAAFGILRLCARGFKQKEIANMYGIHQVTVSGIRSGKHWVSVIRPDGLLPRHRNKLNAEMALKIKSDLIAGEKNQQQISAEHGVADSTINAIRTGVTWKHVGPEVPKAIPRPHCKFSPDDYTTMREMRAAGAKLKEIADKFGTRIDTVQKILAGKRGTSAPVIPQENRKNKPKLPADVVGQLFDRYKNGEKVFILAAEVGMSKSGLGYAFARLKEAA